MKYNILYTPEYEKWFETQEKAVKNKIMARLTLLEEHGYFGHLRNLDENLFELK